MHQSNPPPLNTSFSPSEKPSVVFEPYVLHILSSVIKDLQFLQQQGYISQVALEEIVERLPKPVKVHDPPHTPPAPSPSPSPIPQPESPAVSTKSDTSQKHNSTVSTPQRPPSSSSQSSQQQKQPSLYPLVQNNPNVEDDHQNQQESQQKFESQRRPTPPQLTASPSPLQDTHELKPAMPSRVSSFQPITPPQSIPNISNTGAILATRPLPLPPNASSSSPPRPQPLPVFNNKYEEVEYERSVNQQRDFKDTALPPYSVSIVEAMWDFLSDDPGDLSFNKGDLVEVVEYVNPDWWKGRVQGSCKVGIFPRIYTKILTRHNNVPENNAAYYPRLPQNSYSSSHPTYQRSHSPIQNQQLPPTQQLLSQQLPSQQLPSQQLQSQQLPSQQLQSQQLQSQQLQSQQLQSQQLQSQQLQSQQNYTPYLQLQHLSQSGYANHVPDSRYIDSRNSTSSNGQHFKY